MEVGRPARHDLALGEHGHPVCQCLDLVHVVRREQHRGAGGRQPPDQLPRVPSAGGVEAGRRLVEEEQLRVADDAEPHIEAALLAAREPLDPIVRLLFEADHLDDLIDGPGRGVIAGVAAQHLAHRVVRLDCQLLEHDPDAGAKPALGLPAGRVDAERLDLAAATVPETLQYLDRCRLAGAVRPEQGEDLALLDLEAHVADGFELAVGLGQVSHADRRHVGQTDTGASRRTTGGS